MKRSRKGFTLVELLVVVGIIALLVTILMPTLGRAMELARRSICGANANGIGKQILIYQTEHEAFPLLYRWGDCSEEVSTGTDSDDLWDEATLGHNPMQNVWLLIKYGCTDKMFECPSDDDYQARDDTLPGNQTPQEYGWLDKRNYSYGLHKPYSDTEDATGNAANKAPLTQEPDQGSFVILADKNGRAKSSKSSKPGRVFWVSDNNCNKPANHKDDGFNCLTYQGSVKFYKCKMGTAAANSKAGVNDDDVYTVWNAATMVPVTPDKNPMFDYDTFIVPWDTSS